jgi:hypothetical protein
MMTDLLRRLRGALGIGLTWGVSWAALGALLGVIVGIVRPSEIDPGEGPATIARVLGLVGLISGVGFAALLSLAERRKSLGELSLVRAALWGFLGAAAIPALTGADATMGLISGSLGALFATGSIATARRRQLSRGESPFLGGTDRGGSDRSDEARVEDPLNRC